MKINKSTAIGIICLIFLMLCSSISLAADEKREVVNTFAGSFDSKFHSDGTMEFKLFSDGTLEGSWLTENKTVTLDVRGNYIIKNSWLITTGSGVSNLRSAIESRVIVFAAGKLNDDTIQGNFLIFIENPDFPDDSGTWSAERVSQSGD